MPESSQYAVPALTPSPGIPANPNICKIRYHGSEVTLTTVAAPQTSSGSPHVAPCDQATQLTLLRVGRHSATHLAPSEGKELLRSIRQSAVAVAAS